MLGLQLVIHATVFGASPPSIYFHVQPVLWLDVPRVSPNFLVMYLSNDTWGVLKSICHSPDHTSQSEIFISGCQSLCSEAYLIRIWFTFRIWSPVIRNCARPIWFLVSILVFGFFFSVIWRLLLRVLWWSTILQFFFFCEPLKQNRSEASGMSVWANWITFAIVIPEW